MKIRNLLATAALCLSSMAVNATTVIQPTDGDVNVYIDFGSLAGLSQGYTLGMFDNSVTTITDMTTAHVAGDVLMIASNQVVGITGPNGSGDFIATGTNPVDTLILSNTNEFVLGVYNGSDWFVDMGTGILNFGANSETIIFDTGEDSNSVFLGDVTVTAVPVPAAVWLFGAGLLGLVGVARRRA